MFLDRLLQSPAAFPLIRHKAALDKLPLDRFQVRVARTAREYEDAFRLVYVGYAFQGILPVREEALRWTEHHLLRESTVLVAYEGSQLVGTLTVILDSPAGLPLDRNYPLALARLRKQGARATEVGSLCVVKRCWRAGVAPLLAMAAGRLAFRMLGASHGVIGVHPRAVPMYRALWGYQPMGAPMPHSELCAPVNGIQIDRDTCRQHLERYWPRRLSSGCTISEQMFGDACPSWMDLGMSPALPEWSRWKMSREVFRRLFVERTQAASTVSERTRAQLHRQRSDQTLLRHSKAS